MRTVLATKIDETANKGSRTREKAVQEEAVRLPEKSEFDILVARGDCKVMSEDFAGYQRKRIRYFGSQRRL